MDIVTYFWPLTSFVISKNESRSKIRSSTTPSSLSVSNSCWYFLRQSWSLVITIRMAAWLSLIELSIASVEFQRVTKSWTSFVLRLPVQTGSCTSTSGSSSSSSSACRDLARELRFRIVFANCSLRLVLCLNVPTNFLHFSSRGAIETAANSSFTTRLSKCARQLTYSNSLELRIAFRKYFLEIIYEQHLKNKYWNTIL